MGTRIGVSRRDSGGLRGIVALGRDSDGLGGGIVVSRRDSGGFGGAMTGSGRVSAFVNRVARLLDGILGSNSCNAFLFLY